MAGYIEYPYVTIYGKQASKYFVNTTLLTLITSYLKIKQLAL